MGNKQLTIGMFGFGNVGRGLYDVLNTISSKEAVIKRVCVLDITKERGIDADFFTDNAEELFADKDINLIVELIDDAEAAYHIVKRALTSGISAVSGNKKMLAHHLPELIEFEMPRQPCVLAPLPVLLPRGIVASAHHAYPLKAYALCVQRLGVILAFLAPFWWGLP